MMERACFGLNPRRQSSSSEAVFGSKRKDSTLRLGRFLRTASATGECGAFFRTAVCEDCAYDDDLPDFSVLNDCLPDVFTGKDDKSVVEDAEIVPDEASTNG